MVYFLSCERDALFVWSHVETVSFKNAATGLRLVLVGGVAR